MKGLVEIHWKAISVEFNPFNCRLGFDFNRNRVAGIVRMGPLKFSREPKRCDGTAAFKRARRPSFLKIGGSEGDADVDPQTGLTRLVAMNDRPRSMQSNVMRFGQVDDPDDKLAVKTATQSTRNRQQGNNR